MFKILFVCHGNICRSPMAEFVMKDIVKKNHLEKDFFISSAATSTEEIGNGVHRGTKAILSSLGISANGKTAVQMTPSDYAKYDYIIGMDTMNIRNILRICKNDPDDKVFKLLDFTGSGADISDPWYTGNFEETYRDVSDGCNALLKEIIGDIKKVQNAKRQ